jgi:hypothetical protein
LFSTESESVSPTPSSTEDTAAEKAEKAAKKKNTPFTRVDPTKYVPEHEALRDNSYKGGSGTYGDKASADLIVTRGKGFTKEKNKVSLLCI